MFNLETMDELLELTPKNLAAFVKEIARFQLSLA